MTLLMVTYDNSDNPQVLTKYGAETVSINPDAIIATRIYDNPGGPKSPKSNGSLSKNSNGESSPTDKPKTPFGEFVPVNTGGKKEKNHKKASSRFTFDIPERSLGKDTDEAHDEITEIPQDDDYDNQTLTKVLSTHKKGTKKPEQEGVEMMTLMTPVPTNAHMLQ